MKLKKVLTIAGIMVLVGVASYAGDNEAARVAGNGNYGNACKLIEAMGGVFRTLRTLAFVGAAFVLVGWAWTFISAGYGVDKSTDVEAARKKSIGFIIGFSLLFGLGLVMQFLPGSLGCETAWKEWGAGAVTTSTTGTGTNTGR